VIVVGLTGSIAMGKSTVAALFAVEGAPVFDSDVAVHSFYSGPGAQRIEAAFPGVLIKGAVDRELLSQWVLGDRAALARLEAIVHPEVASMRRTFVLQAEASGRRLVVVDAPLLFESGGEKSVDLVVVVSASETVQKARALARPGMTLERFRKIVGRQTPDANKRRGAHMVIDTNGSIEATRAQVLGFLRCAAGMVGKRTSLNA
jgi:dephospho-CoA kinase